jgi:hypothetical protein
LEELALAFVIKPPLMMTRVYEDIQPTFNLMCNFEESDKTQLINVHVVILRLAGELSGSGGEGGIVQSGK